MKTNFLNKAFSIVLISMLALISSFTFIFATGELEQQGNSLILLQAKASGSKNIQLTWDTKDLNAESYTVYGTLYGKKFKEIATTKNNKFLVENINKKKLKAHKVYKFYVKADKIKSNNCIVIAGKTFGKNGKYSNPRKITTASDDSTINLKPGESFVLSKLGFTTKIYKGKKHLSVKKYGKKYTYILSDNTNISINGKKITASSSIKEDITASLYIQEINGIYKEITINVIVDKESSNSGNNQGNKPGPNVPTYVPDPNAMEGIDFN